jgi:hypothetical protein
MDEADLLICPSGTKNVYKIYDSSHYINVGKKMCPCQHISKSCNLVNHV